jgi:hypothetical protein
LAAQNGSSAGSVVLHTQVPPLSATMLAFTEMMYLSCVSEQARAATRGSQTHAMAKKVAKPARISVKKYDPFRSLGCGSTV